MRRIILALILTLAACAPRGALTYAPKAADVGTVRPVFVATTRGRDGQRSETVDFGRIDVSVPPDRAPGQITYPKRGAAPDPRRDFLVTHESIYAGQRQFQAEIGKALKASPAGEREVVLFVHGYNNTFAEGLYRFVQLAHDLKFPGVEVHFAWPSRGQPLAYVADRDSAMISRDGLEQTIRAAQDAGARKVIIVGHSMGAYLVMETLRQMALKGESARLGRLGGVVLFSPDIDVDLFRMQAKAIGELPQPFFIFTSSRDRALRLSALVSGEPARLGTLTDARPLSDLRVTLIDNTAFATGDGHFNAATSPALLRILAGVSQVGDAFGRDGGQVGLITGAALTVERAAQIVLEPAEELLQR